MGSNLFVPDLGKDIAQAAKKILNDGDAIHSKKNWFIKASFWGG